MKLLNTIIGDILGSEYEFEYILKDSKVYKSLLNKKIFLSSKMHITDDTILLIATADALLELDYLLNGNSLDTLSHKQIYDIFKSNYHAYGNDYNSQIFAYGKNFRKWFSKPYNEAQCYNSFGSGITVRVVPISYYAKTLQEAEILATYSAMCTHNHIQGIKAARETAKIIFQLRNGATKKEVASDFNYDYLYNIDKVTLDETCMSILPLAFKCFNETNDIYEALEKALTIGIDTDTTSALTCAMSEAYYGIDEDINNKAKEILLKTDKSLYNTLKEFNNLCNKRA